MHRHKKNPPKPSEAAKKVSESLHDPERIRSDPFGSYTGVPKNATEVPVQDADDL